MDDLTVLYISASNMPEKWVKFQIGHLLRASRGAEIISVTRKPLSLGTNHIEKERQCYWNIYRQMLRASKLAKTKFVAMAEDDTLYSREHFTQYRPPDDAVSYNRARWSLFEWDPIYCLRQRVSNCSLIAPRELLIEALTERERKYPDGTDYVGEVGRRKVDRKMGVSPRKMVEWYSTVPVIQLNHRSGTDTGRGKKHGQITALDIPYWGKAKDIVETHYSEYS